MVKKYIIELERGTHIFVLGPEGITHIGEPDVVYETVDGMQIGDAVINAKPYTEPDLEQIRMEAYEDGYKTAKVQCNIQAEKDLREVGERHYQKGLSHAWEAARKISLAKIDGGFSWESMNNMFGTDSPSKIYKTFTASEAIEKIRQYEQEEDRQARIEFNCEEIKDVLNTTVKECNVSLDEIATVLEKMRGEQDG